jgi:hypothetical protein
MGAKRVAQNTIEIAHVEHQPIITVEHEVIEEHRYVIRAGGFVAGVKNVA